MAQGIEQIFENKEVNLEKLLRFGFVADGAEYVYQATLSESGFQLTVRMRAQGEMTAEVWDPVSRAPYTLHLVDRASGRFVGSVRSQYEEVLRQIAAQCFDADVFQSAQARALIAHVRGAYGDELEFLWPKFPRNAVWRRRDTGKWYAALLTVSKRKLGLASDAQVEILDLRLQPERLEALIDHRAYFPGYHMNKRHWYTVLLDGSVADAALFAHVDDSYRLAT